jgi:hypothetical protein
MEDWSGAAAEGAEGGVVLPHGHRGLERHGAQGGAAAKGVEHRRGLWTCGGIVEPSRASAMPTGLLLSLRPLGCAMGGLLGLVGQTALCFA